MRSDSASHETCRCDRPFQRIRNFSAPSRKEVHFKMDQGGGERAKELKNNVSSVVARILVFLKARSPSIFDNLSSTFACSEGEERNMEPFSISSVFMDLVMSFHSLIVS